MGRYRADFLPQKITEAQIEAWSDILPSQFHIIAANLFLDIFMLDAAGAVFMLEASAASATQIAASKEEFDQQCIDDENGWLLRPLIQQCLAAGMTLDKSQCYAFTTLPFLGGEYHVDNIWICQWTEWLAALASAYSQTKHLPDGTIVKIKVVE